MLELNAMTAIAGRDLLKFFRDPGRLVAAVVFPFLMIFLLGGTLQLNLGQSAGAFTNQDLFTVDALSGSSAVPVANALRFQRSRQEARATHTR